MTSIWFFLSILNYDARSTTHQIYLEVICPSHSPCGLMRRFAAAGFLGSRISNSAECVGVSLTCFLYCVGSGLLKEVIIRAEDS